ncbi:MAG: Fe(2+)-trafficking protein [Planctomycetota bacterium]|nr:Fe(2+)-trafficking protein [Planctomycetota bacterium]MEC8818727.1 Fe(2+)-trafficking protein [Planctomycetota bacterium]MEC9233887.1 Fe(2+)-trafficking protein [Planctomycetota bacterium]MED6307497.1 Fe(2+)-trafficking protein [Planctomycetota bacterium]
MTNPPTDLEQRIERFEHMAKADPENEMAHFSLGNAYSQMGRHAEAAEAFEECTRINPEMSKAWQLCGQEMVQAGWEDKAVMVLERGYEVAASKGDLMPRDAIADLLRSIGKQPPELSQEVNEAAERIRESGAFVCGRTGRPGTRMEHPPFRGPVGEWIRDNISQETWTEWIGQGTKVINELRLDLSREEDQEAYDQHMHEFLGVDPEALGGS